MILFSIIKIFRVSATIFHFFILVELLIECTA